MNLRKLRIALWVLAVAVLAGAGGYAGMGWLRESENTATTVRIGGPFVMTDQDGRQVTDKT